MSELEKRFAQSKRAKEMKIMADAIFDALEAVVPLMVKREVERQLASNRPHADDDPLSAAALKAMGDRHAVEMRARGFSEPNEQGLRFSPPRPIDPRVRMQQEKMRRVMAEIRQRAERNK